jgi:hypothetical protein
MTGNRPMLALAPGTHQAPGTGANTDTPSTRAAPALPGSSPTVTAPQLDLFGGADPLWPALTGRPQREWPDQTDPNGTPLTAVAHAVRRGASPDYWRWLDHVTPAAGCTRPIQLRGQVHEVSPRTGAVITTRSTGGMPDGVVYKACGNRRASACPSCAETYRADTYQLILAGINGGKGIPDTVQLHPCVFPTFTAPSFGPVHSTPAKRTRTPAGMGGEASVVHRVCRPGRKPRICPHGIDLRCGQVHAAGESILGTPLCLDCDDHAGQVVWNLMSGELWRRTMQTFKDTLRVWAGEHHTRLRPSYVKVAEMQARGVAHFHALIRLDGHDPDDPGRLLAPHPHADHRLLRAALTHAVTTTRFRSPPHPDRPGGWLIQWGGQFDIREVRLTVKGDVTETAVAGYLAKYATKSTETAVAGYLSGRVTADTVDDHTAIPASHPGRLIAACWYLGRPGCDDHNPRAATNSGRLAYTRLRRWAHMLGFGGHFSTKSRAYSTTLKALRQARLTWRREHHRTVEHIDVETTLIVGALSYAATGWRTTGDALLANTAAAQARKRRQVGKEEAQHLDTYVSEHVDQHQYA